MAVIPTPTSPCDWGVTWADVRASGCVSCGKVTTTADQAALIAKGVALVWAATGRRFGVCEVTWRPCLWCRCGCPGACGCTYYDTLDLNPEIDAGGAWLPVQGVSQVTENGVTLTAGVDYRLRSNRWLLRMPSGETWPACQDDAADTPVLQVTWTRGVPPDDDLILNGVLPLIREMANAHCNEPCSLNPAIVQHVVREGITFGLISQGEAWRDGGTGMAGVDAAIARAWPPGMAMPSVGGMVDPREILRPAWSRVDSP